MIQRSKFDSSIMNIKNIVNTAKNFIIERVVELIGIVISILGILLLISLISYSPEDPNFIFPDNIKIENILGFYGSFTSDLFFQSIGIIAYLIPLTLFFTGINIFKHKFILILIENLFFVIIYSVFGSLFFSYFYSDTFNLYINGNGGFVGSYLNQSFLNNFLDYNENISYYILIVIILFLFLISINFKL